MERRYLFLLLALAIALAVVEGRLSLGLCSADQPCKSTTDFCHYPDGACGSGTGVCEIPAEACTKEYAPVCGCDGITYSNPCMAHSAGVSVRGLTACNETHKNAKVRLCGQDQACDEGSFCKLPTGMCTGTGACHPKPEFCTAIYSPVCGCDGQTYPSECVAEVKEVALSAEGECKPSIAKKDIACSNNADCGEDGAYCKFALGSCSGTGVCSGRPEMCTMLYHPVCGCDGVSYSNMCMAGSAGVSAKAMGQC